MLFVLGLVAAGGVSAGIATSTGTTTTGTTTEPQTIAPDVTVGGVQVGGLTADDAFEAVDSAFLQPLPLLVLRHRVLVTPDQIGATALVQAAVDRALTAAPGTALSLRVKLNRPKSQAFVASVARTFDRKPVDAKVLLRNLRPWIRKQKPRLGAAADAGPGLDLHGVRRELPRAGPASGPRRSPPGSRLGASGR